MRFCTGLLLFSCAVFAQTSPVGKWISILKFFDEPNYGRLQLELNGTRLTGKLGNDAFEGTFQNGQIEGTVKPNPRTTIQLHGTVQNERIEGSGRVVEQKIDLKWEATREPAQTNTAATTHNFEPTQFITSSRTPSNQPCISTPEIRSKRGRWMPAAPIPTASAGLPAGIP
jgi:hypothetical protein